MIDIEGIVSHIIFRNDTNGYTVFEFDTEEDQEVVVGYFSTLMEGEGLKLTGEYVEHATYGQQFKASAFAPLAPTDELSMERYLGSGAIKGIGPVVASRIVRHFKKDTFKIIDEEPERLAEIKGISSKKAREIGILMQERKAQREAMIFLQEKGISPAMCVRIYDTYGDALYGVINNNPYQLAEDVDGLGFKTADEIATKMGFKVDSSFRIRSGIIYTLQLAASEGHTYLPVESLTRNASSVLNVDPEWITPIYQELQLDKKIFILDDKIYTPVFYYCENNAASMLHQLNKTFEINEDNLEKYVNNLEEDEGMLLDELQKEAIRLAAKSGLFILTGGPGTGKTTTIKAIISYFEDLGAEIALAAPTGRAAKRMTEATGRPAKTIHRLLEVKGLSGDGKNGMFEKNEDNPLEEDVIIIDEMSMVDIFLFHSLLKAVSGNTQLILVGDANQLPSVGPGNVLKDIISSEVFPTICLHNIFRQSESSDIVVNAHKIQNDEPVMINNKSSDFFILRRNNPSIITQETITLVKEKIPKYVSASSFDIQVLTPTKKGNLGVWQLNKDLQAALNPPSKDKAEHLFGDRIYRVGDKVMQIKNDYQLPWVSQKKGELFATEHGMGVFNGDMGQIESINSYTEIMTVRFDDDRVVDYPFKILDELELAYSVTIHKSQGSEYPAVIIPLLSGPRPLMNKNLIYTAITRAKSCVVIVGDENVFHEMCKNQSQTKRYSSLSDRILEQQC